MTTLTLFCVLDGGPLDKPFPVDIAEGKSIGHLKDMVKERLESELKDIDARTLAIYGVSVLAGNVAELQLAIDRLDEKKDDLPSWKSVGKLFPAPATEHVHVVIRTPSSKLPS